MTVGELIKRLQQYNPDTEVMVYDGESSEYCKLTGVVKITCSAAAGHPKLFYDADHSDKNAIDAVLVD